MTEPTNSPYRERLEQRLEDLERAEASEQRDLSRRFTVKWETLPEYRYIPISPSLPGGTGHVLLEAKGADAASHRPVDLWVDIHRVDAPPMLSAPEDAPNIVPLSLTEAASRLGVTPRDVSAAVHHVQEVVGEDLTRHQTLEDLHEGLVEGVRAELNALDAGVSDRLAEHEEDLARAGEVTPHWEEEEVVQQWATDPLDQPYTPERVSADWIQATTTIEAYLAADRADLARNLIDEIDTNLRDFADGGYPPGSDELSGIYTDAIWRSAIPYGPSPISADEVARQLNGIGFTVPTLDLDTIASRTGVSPLSPEQTVRRIDGDFAAAWEQSVGNSYSQPVSHGPVSDYGFGAPAVTVSIGDARDWDTSFRVSLESDGSAALTVSGDDPVDVATISQTTGLPEDEVKAVIVGATTALRSTLPDADPALLDVASARGSVRRALVSITKDSETAQSHLKNADRLLTEAVDVMRPDAKNTNVVAAKESLEQASEKVAAVAETAAKVDAEVTVYTTDGCPGCFATKRALDKAGVEYDEISLKEHPDLVAKFKKQLGKEGQSVTAPIVQTKDGDLWAGYNPGKLKEHGLDHRTRQQRRGETNRDTGHGR